MKSKVNLTPNEQRNQLRRAALQLLARREYSQKELRHKLIAKYPLFSDQLNSVLDNLANEGFLSDSRFTESCVRSSLNRGYGPRRIRKILEENAISSTIIEQYLDENANLWHEKIAAVWQKRFSGKKPETYAEYAKQACFLQYRGFSSEQIKAFLDNCAKF